MGYVLGVDLGTTFSAVAIARDGRAEIVTLGSRSAAIPSMVLLRADGEVLVGEAAERRASSEPERTAREFKRRLGDPTPMLLGGTPYGAEALMAHLLRVVVERVIELEGERPERIVVCHPANYGPFKRDLLEQAVRIAAVGPVMFLTEPQAAAVHYASQERVEVGEYIAVYDFGGGTFDAAVLQKTEDGFALLGEPEGLERLGGVDLDQAVFGHVERSLGGAFDALNFDDPIALAAFARLRDECRAAKEALSHDTDAQIPVLLPNVQTEVRITRNEFEGMVRPRIGETVDALERAIHSAGLQNEQISRVLLVGGSSRIPLVAQLVREGTGRPIAVDAHPKHAIAMGAALAASAYATAASEPPQAAPPPPAPPAAPPTPSAAKPPQSDSKRRIALIAAAAVVLVAAAVIAALALASGGDEKSDAVAQTTTSTVSAAGNATSSLLSATSVSTVSGSASTSAAAAVGGVGGRLATIDRIRLEGDTYVVDFTTANFTPAMGGPNDSHIHFYFGTSDVVNLLTGGASGPYKDHAGGSPYRGLKTSDRPAGVIFLCISVADANHTPARLSGNCAPLPN